jgi:hypothetical protein
MGKRRKSLTTVLDQSDGLNEEKFYRFFNIKRISDRTGINLDKLYNNLKDFYRSIQNSEVDKKKIADVLKPQVKQMFAWLGYDVEFTKQGK